MLGYPANTADLWGDYMATNIVTAVFGASRVVKTRALYQWDYGQVLQFEGLDLPAAYTVHFSNQGIQGTAKTQVGNADGVSIPDEYLTTGLTVYAWVYLHAGEDDGETEYAVIIPVTARPKSTEDEPTPVQQGVVDQAIAALNAGVQDVQEAVEGVQDAIDTALQEAKASGEFDGEDGVSPTVDVTEITGGHRVSITDAEGTESFDVMNGVDGEDGVSPTATVTQTATGATISITDAEGTTTAEITNGQNGTPGAPGAPGADGISPTIIITDITGGHRVTITDATGAHSFDVMDGDAADAPVQDVQVNGISVLDAQGVANVPVAGAGVMGAVQVSGYGLTMQSNGYISTKAATNLEIKAGTRSWEHIAPQTQHASAFYGLAKSAGDTTQSQSSNAVGTYTENAKSKISEMLSGPVTVTGSTPSIPALPGICYVCGEVTTIDITLPASGIVDVVFTSGSTPAVLTVTPPTGMTVEWANGFDSTALEADTMYELNIKMVGTKCLGVAASWT